MKMDYYILRSKAGSLFLSNSPPRPHETCPPSHRFVILDKEFCPDLLPGQCVKITEGQMRRMVNKRRKLYENES